MATTVVIPNPLPVTGAFPGSLHVSAAYSNAATTVPGSSYAIVTYYAAGNPYTVYLGPGQSLTGTYGISGACGGVVLTNT